MYEAKYSKYMIHNSNRFAEEDEILEGLTPIESGAGIPLYAADGQIYVDGADTNTITIGPTGCGKTRAVNKLLLYSIFNAEHSVIINDPKGELFEATVDTARAKGYNVNVLNLRNPNASDGWNPLHMIYSFYKSGQTSKANQLTDEFSTSLMETTVNKDDRYWDGIASHYLSAVIKLFLSIMPGEEYFTLNNILPFLSRDAENDLKKIIMYHDNIPATVMSALKGVINLDAEKTKTCIYSVVSAGVDHLVRNENLLNIFSGGDIKLDKIGTEQKPAAIYIIYPDEQMSLDNVVNSFITQSYIALNWESEKYPGGRLPRCVHFDLEEFSNLCAIDKFDNRISECRSKNIRFHLFIQSMNQLSEKYSEATAETILSNCTSWICFSSKEIKFLNTISQICGKITDWHGDTKPLISSADLQYLKKGESAVEVLVLRQGVHPYVTSLPYYDKCKFYSPVTSKGTIAHVKRKPVQESGKYCYSPSEWAALVRKAFPDVKKPGSSSDKSNAQDELKKSLIKLFDTLDED